MCLMGYLKMTNFITSLTYVLMNMWWLQRPFIEGQYQFSGQVVHLAVIFSKMLSIPARQGDNAQLTLFPDFDIVWYTPGQTLSASPPEYSCGTWVDGWMDDSDICSGVGSNTSGSSYGRWCQKVPVLPANWLYNTIPAWNFWVDGFPGESQGRTTRAAVSQLWVAVSQLQERSRELASRESAVCGCKAD